MYLNAFDFFPTRVVVFRNTRAPNSIIHEAIVKKYHSTTWQLCFTNSLGYGGPARRFGLWKAVRSAPLLVPIFELFSEKIESSSVKSWIPLSMNFQTINIRNEKLSILSGLLHHWLCFTIFFSESRDFFCSSPWKLFFLISVVKYHQVNVHFSFFSPFCVSGSCSAHFQLGFRPSNFMADLYPLQNHSHCHLASRYLRFSSCEKSWISLQ